MSPRNRFLVVLLSVLPGAVAHAQYPVRRVSNGCGLVTTAFQTTGQVRALSVIQTGDAHVLVQGENTLRRFAFNGTQTFAVATTGSPTDAAATSTGDTWVISRSGNALQRFTGSGTLGATYGASIAGTDPVAVTAIGSGAGGIADAWIVTGSTRQLRRVGFTGVLSWTQSLTGTPVDVCAHATGESWVVTQGPNQLRKFAANGFPGVSVGLGGLPVAVDVDAAGNVAVATTGPDQLVSVAWNGTPRYTVALPAAPGGVAIDPSGNPAVTLPGPSELRRYAFSTGALLCTAAVPYSPAALDVNPGNGELLVAAEPPPWPLPRVQGLAPYTALVGGPSFTLSVSGTGFVPSSIVRWNGADLPTTTVSSTVLTASVTAAHIAALGTVAITVFNPPPGGGLSNNATFVVGQLRAATSPYGTGCSGGGAAVPLLAVSGVPRLGTTYRLEVNAAPAQTPVVFFVGASRTDWLGLPLPLPLAPFGAPNCTLLASGEVQVGAATSAAGAASLSLLVPNAVALVGQRVFQQVAVVDRRANALGLVFTSALVALLGDV